MGRMAIWLLIAVAIGGAMFIALSGDGDPSGDLAYFDDSGAVDDSARSGPALRAGGKRREAGLGTADGAYVITGSVLDPAGKPVPDVPIEVRRTGPARVPGDPTTWYRGPTQRIESSLARMASPTQRLHPVVGGTKSGADGTFKLNLSSSGKYELVAKPVPPSLGTQATVSVHDEQPKQEALLHVMQGSKLFGRVLDAAGQGVSCTLSASWASRTMMDPRSWSSGPVETSAEDGAFVFPAVPEGKVSITAYLSASRRLSGISVNTPHKGEFLITVETGAGGIHGTLSDAQGTPIGGATLLVGVRGEKNADGFALSVTLRTRTGVDGTYLISDAPLGKVILVQGLAEGFLPLQQHERNAPWKHVRVEAKRPLQLDLQMSRGGSVVGVVTDQAGGKPLAEAEVTLFPARSNQGSAGTPRVALTDAGGHYRVDGVAMGRYVAIPKKAGYYLPELAPSGAANRVMPNSTRSGPRSLTVLITEEGVVFDRPLTLARGLAVSGRVVDAAGHGVDAAEIHARGYGMQQVGWQWGINPSGPSALAKSDASGIFQVDGLPPKADWVLYAKKKAYAGSFGSPFSLADGEAAPEVTLKLIDGGVLRGKVTDEDGKPAVGAQVGFWGRGTELAGDNAHKKVSADGTFELTGVPPGDWTLNVWTNGSQGPRLPVKGLMAGEVREGLELTIAAGFEVTGVVVDQDGKPVRNQHLMLQPIGGGGWAQGSTDGDGRFHFKGVKKGKAQLTTWGGSGTERIGRPFDAPASDLRLVYEKQPEVTIRGRVLDPAGKPIPLCSVQVRATKKSRGNAPPLPIMSAGGDALDVLNGVFKRQVSGKAPFTVSVSSPRDVRGLPMNLMPKTEKVEDPTKEVVIQLEGGLSISGLVVDESGKGFGGVQVRVGQESASTAADGSFSIGGLQKGKHSVHSGKPPGYVQPARQQVEAGATGLRFELEKGLTIKGRAVGEDNEPVKLGYASGTWKKTAGILQGSANGQLRPDGTFTLDGVPGGARVKVTVQVWNQGGGRSYAPTTVDDVRAGTEDLVIKLGGGLSIEGILLDAEGKPASGVYVHARAKDGDGNSGWIQTDAKGAWKLSGLKPATYFVQVMQQGNRPVPDPVEVDAPAVAVRVQLPRSIAVSGTLIGPGVEEMRGWRVIAYRKGTQIGQTRVQADGTWSFDALGEGSAVVYQAVKPLNSRYARSDPLAGARDGITLHLKEGATISGTVHGAEDVVNLNIWASRADGGFGYGLYKKEDGTFVIKGLAPGRYKVTARDYRGGGQVSSANVEAGTTGLRLTLPGGK